MNCVLRPLEVQPLTVLKVGQGNLDIAGTWGGVCQAWAVVIVLYGRVPDSRKDRAVLVLESLDEVHVAPRTEVGSLAEDESSILGRHAVSLL